MSLLDQEHAAVRLCVQRGNPCPRPPRAPDGTHPWVTCVGVDEVGHDAETVQLRRPDEGFRVAPRWAVCTHEVARCTLNLLQRLSVVVERILKNVCVLDQGLADFFRCGS